jgi:hypothetical protein
MQNKIYISEGHYKDNDGNEYMSIWTFKRTNGLQIDTNQNYEDAKSISCSDKFFGPFNASNRFKEGWMYNVNCLREFIIYSVLKNLFSQLTYLKTKYNNTP